MSFVAAALSLTALFGTGCAADADDAGEEEVGEAEGEIGSVPKSAGIKAGSPEEEGVLLLVNDRAVTLEVLKARTRLTASVAKSIIAFRTGPDGREQRWFSTVDEIDALPLTGKAAFQRLVADANASAYVEAPGFDGPTLAKISVPSNLGRPPTSNDVTVEAGFDGVPAEQAALLVRARLTNTVDASNERFVARTIRDNHKAFTLAIGNLFAQGSPHATFAKSLGADKLTLLGTMSSLNPTILLAEKAGAKTYYARGASGRYEPIETPKYAVTMRARIRLETGAAGDPGQGVRTFYPAWSAKQLIGPTTVITEGGS